MIAALGVALAAPLELDEVLAAVDARVPRLAAAEARVDEAEGRLLASGGAFEPVWSSKLGGYTGHDPRSYGETSVSVRSPLGPAIEAGWAWGQGAFPTYDDRGTGPVGELRAEIGAPLLDGLGFGPERAAREVARAGVERSRADLDWERVRARLAATEAWLGWVAAGAELGVERELLDQAERRSGGLDRQVEEGARPRIDALDNLRVVEERRARVVAAQRQLDVAALSLSLWLRDAEGRPIAPTADRLPALPPAPSVVEGDPAARPDLRAAEAAVEAAHLERRRAGQALRPDLLVQAGVSDGSGYGDEVWAGLELKVPVLARKERGDIARAGAAAARAAADQRDLADRVQAEVRAAELSVEAARERLEWTRASEATAAEVLALETRRWELGATDLFQLLAREANLAAARRATVAATVDHHLAVARLAAARGR